jgi:hypothetical protein
MGIQMVIKKDKEGNKFVEVNKEKFYIENLDETVDDLISIINSLRQAEKIALKYEEDDDELLEVIRKKIAYYTAVLKEIYSGD